MLFEGEATQVITRTTEGDVAFLANHAPFLGTLVEGRPASTWPTARVSDFQIEGGFVEVSNDTVSILVT